MISLEEVLVIHEILIERFGGASGIRDKSLLESAITRPYMKFDNRELYPSVESKAAAIIESILINHPFLDGNKRTGYVLLRMILLVNGIDIKASEDEKYNCVISIAAGEMKFDNILKWLSDHSN